METDQSTPPPRPGVNTIVFENPVSRGVKAAGASALEWGAAARQRFIAKPGQTSTYILAAAAFVVILITMLPMPWWQFSTQPVLGIHASGGVTLLSMTVCYDANGGRRAYAPSSTCTMTELRNSATSIDYFHKAGATAFAFLFVTLLLLLPAQWVMNVRRQDKVATVVHPRLAFLASWIVPTLLYALAVIFVAVSWTVYYGLVGAQYNPADFQRVALAGAAFRYDSFSAGPALAIFADVLLVAALLLSVIFRNEKNRSLEAHVSATAYAAAFSGASESALPVTLPPAYVHTEDPSKSKSYDAPPLPQETKEGPGGTSSSAPPLSASSRRSGALSSTTAPQVHIQRLSASPAEGNAMVTPQYRS